jgi:hypothetical protein
LLTDVVCGLASSSTSTLHARQPSAKRGQDHGQDHEHRGVSISMSASSVQRPVQRPPTDRPRRQTHSRAARDKKAARRQITVTRLSEFPARSQREGQDFFLLRAGPSPASLLAHSTEIGCAPPGGTAACTSPSRAPAESQLLTCSETFFQMPSPHHQHILDAARWSQSHHTMISMSTHHRRDSCM